MTQEYTDFKQVSIDTVIGHRLKENWTPEVVQTLSRQQVTAVARDLVTKLAPGFDLVTEDPPQHSAECPVEEPHDHAGYSFRIVPSEWLQAMKEKGIEAL